MPPEDNHHCALTKMSVNVKIVRWRQSKPVNFSLFRGKDTKWAAKSKLGRAALLPRPSKREKQNRFENVFLFVLSRFKNKTKQARPPKTGPGLWHLPNQGSKCYRMRRVSLPGSHFTVESMYLSEHQEMVCMCLCVRVLVHVRVHVWC